jgi:hypothetical protein
VSEIERSTRKTRETPAWAGTMEELTKLGRVIEAPIEARQKGLLAESDWRKPSPAETKEVELPDGRMFQLPQVTSLEGITWQNEHSRIQDMTVRMTYSERDDTVTASIDQVLQEVDRRAVDSIKVFLGLYLY